MRLMLILVAAIALISVSSADVLLDGKTAPILGSARFSTIAGGAWKLIEHPVVIRDVGYTAIDCRCRSISFSVIGWDRFTAHAALPDGSDAVTIAVEVDGRQIMKQPVRRGDPLPIDIPISGGRTLTLRQSAPVIYLSPTLVGGVDLAIGCDGSGNVLPECFDRLAADLRTAVDADPAVRSRMARSRVAISTFELIGADRAPVAKNAAEDLYTAMIRSGFQLVERGQLDSVLRELKVQDTALIDPATAQKIGRLSGCDVILLGSISDREGRVVINARLMETSTGKSIAADRLDVGKPPSTKRQDRENDHWVVTMRASGRR